MNFLPALPSPMLAQAETTLTKEMTFLSCISLNTLHATEIRSNFDIHGQQMIVGVHISGDPGYDDLGVKCFAFGNASGVAENTNKARE
ncbi:hypothetical protein V6N12_045096 [Hibiscus sabdariffa]|uniref:Uncharacterized protein n=1 Tax=Hibiscus sabdariffa TaxID=183260 RepID=A0ABR2G1U3_9ROSI